MGTNYYYRMTKFRRLGWDVEEKQIGKKISRMAILLSRPGRININRRKISTQPVAMWM